MNNEPDTASGTAPDNEPQMPDTDGPAQDPAPAPGYFPRLLSAAAHVTHLASDSVLERFDLTRDRYSLLNRLALSTADDTALAATTGQPASLDSDLASLHSSGYASRNGQGLWCITDAGRQVIECAKLAEAEITLDAEDSQELRKALRSLISSLRLDRPDGTGNRRP